MVHWSRANVWKGQDGGGGYASFASSYLNHAYHTDKWLKHKPAEKTNKTLLS